MEVIKDIYEYNFASAYETCKEAVTRTVVLDFKM